MRLKTVLALIMALLITSIGVNAWQASTIRRLERQPHSYYGDRPYIDNAIGLWSRFTSEPRSKAMESRYAQVIAIGKEVCVSLSLDRGSVGGVPVYCFDEATRQVSRKFEYVE